VRYFLTVPEADRSGRYITGELAADPDYEGRTPSLSRPALWNLWIDDDVPCNDDVVRYRRDELLLEDWGPAALQAWEAGDDTRHDRTCWESINDLVHQELRHRAERGDKRAIELLVPGHTLEERVLHVWS
jgi:hypothetical protein